MTAYLKEQVVQQSPIGSFSSVKNPTLVSLVCDNGIFNPSDRFSSAWPLMGSTFKNRIIMSACMRQVLAVG